METTVKEYLTAVDLIAAGSCSGGVKKFMERTACAAAMPVKVLLKLATDLEKEHIVKAANLDGYGNGYGDGDGNGYGDGNGNGYGYGYGDGNGNGYGYGDGDGNGYGNGDGNGDGNGNGYGYGNGYGNGYGSL